MRFSEHYNIRLGQPQIDFVDIDVDRDLPLFIDPYSFSQRNDIWSQACHLQIVSFFQAAVDLIRRGEDEHARSLLNNLSEPNETCLGLSQGRPQGRGVSGQQAIDLYNKLAESEAVRTGFLTELADCELLVSGIGPDKISDVTTNIIRNHLIEYTQAQCNVHNISLLDEVASGRLWDREQREWRQEYVRLPVIDSRKILLVPKASVRWNMAMDHKQFYQHFVLNFLQEDNIARGTSLVHTLRSGEPRVYKKDLIRQNPISKELLYSFSREHPEVLRAYKQAQGLTSEISNSELLDNFSERTFARILQQELERIQPGHNGASTYHNFMIGVLEFIFYPNLIYPVKEREIHEGRKRIDISYTNAAIDGLFYRIHAAHNIASDEVMVECKNYSSDPANPELDQLSGRFSSRRGWFGLLVSRSYANRELFLERCRDTARDSRGYIIPLCDEDIVAFLEAIGRRKRNEIDSFIESILAYLRS